MTTDALTYVTCGRCGVRYHHMVAHGCPRQTQHGADASGDRLTLLAIAQGLQRGDGEADASLLRRMGEAIYKRHEGQR